MTWILLGLLLLVALGAFTVVVRVMRSREPGGDRPATRCLQCRGTGWVGGEPERTMSFTGEGFENRHTPARQCPRCDGTGVVRI